MSILVEGMEMPETCKLCYLSEFSAGFYAYVCKPTGVRIDYEMAKVSKPTRICPLVKIPEAHGRLGDLDELYNHLNEWYLTHEHGFSETEKIYIRAMLSGVKDSPTVVPAIEEE